MAKRRYHERTRRPGPGMKRLTLIILISVSLTACVGDNLEPGAAPLRLEARIGRAALRSGDTTSIVFTLRNVTADSIVLHFNDSCQILPYITGRHADHVVHPSGGQWGCYQALTSLHLAPLAAETVTVLVRGGAPVSYPAISLPPGEYLTFALLEHPDFPLRSPMLDLRVE